MLKTRQPCSGEAVHCSRRAFFFLCVHVYILEKNPPSVFFLLCFCFSIASKEIEFREKRTFFFQKSSSNCMKAEVFSSMNCLTCKMCVLRSLGCILSPLCSVQFDLENSRETRFFACFAQKTLKLGERQKNFNSLVRLAVPNHAGLHSFRGLHKWVICCSFSQKNRGGHYQINIRVLKGSFELSVLVDLEGWDLFDPAFAVHIHQLVSVHFEEGRIREGCC